MTNYTFYKIVCNDGHYYYGSTKRLLKDRFNSHKYSSQYLTEMKVYKHINHIGWDKVHMEEVETFEGDRKSCLLKENSFISGCLADPLCLNSQCSGLTDEEKKEHHAVALKKYRESHKEKVKQRMRDAYYKRTYNMTEAEYKR